MAYSFVRASSQRIKTTTTPVTAAPCTLAIWLKPAVVNVNQYALTVGTNNNVHHFGVAISNVGRLRGVAHDGSNYYSQNSTILTAGTWVHGCAIFPSATSRTVYLNGAAGGTDTQNQTVTGLDEVVIGAQWSTASFVDHFDGDLAEAGVWNVALTATEITALRKGISPDQIRPQSLVFYAPLIRDIIDLKGRALTATNSPTVAVHPRMYY